MMGLFAIQEGPWKLILGQGNGGHLRKDAPLANDLPGQLYNLADDPGEMRNLYSQKPDIVARLTTLLGKIRQDGRSRS